MIIATEDSSLLCDGSTVLADILVPCVIDSVGILPTLISSIPSSVTFGVGHGAPRVGSIELSESSDASLAVLIQFDGSDLAQSLLGLFRSGLLWSFVVEITYDAVYTPSIEDYLTSIVPTECRHVALEPKITRLGIDPFAPL